MTGIIVTGHGKFPEGILSAISLVAGKPDNTAAVNFEMGQSSEDLKGAMTGAMESLEGDEVLILADLVGGTPFNTAAALRTERTDRKIKVIAGVNMAALVEAVFSRPMYGLNELAAALLTAGKEGLRDLDALDSPEEGPEFEDGL
ncbi:MAG: PTS sugar transporter subunit IIA [Clostridia bacterium]|nr:PTS sugar transporter subunit IIA [Clostridia bacterium]